MLLTSKISLIQNYTTNILRQNVRTLFISSQDLAARKGTREKARAKKVKVEVKKVGFIPHNKRKVKIDTTEKHIDDSWKLVPTDDAYAGKYYRWRVYSIAEAIECHRETHHPTCYNEPKAPVIAYIELNMQGEKLTRFVDNFNRMAAINYKFDHGQERTILAFCKGQEEIDAARSAGATLAGGSELVKQIQSGDLHLPEFEHVIASTNVLPEILPIRGLLKKRFPNVKNGTLGNNIDEMVTRAMIGINYSATKDLYQKNFGTISSQFGTLDMPVEHLQDNLKNLLIDIDKMRPKREGKFITRVLIKSPPSQEELKIDPYQFVAESRSDFKKSKDLVEEEEEVEEGEDVEKEVERAVN